MMDVLAVRSGGAEGRPGWGVRGFHYWDLEVRGVRDFRGEAGKQRGFVSGVIGPMGG